MLHLTNPLAGTCLFRLSSCYNKKYTLLVWVSSVTHCFFYGFSCFDPCHLCLFLSLCTSSKVDIMNNSFLAKASLDLAL